MSTPLASDMMSDLSAWSRTLGVADPTPLLGEMLEASFDLPRGSAAYRNNELSPGTIPFEISFSERAPSSLRIDLEPWPSKMPPEARRAKITELVVDLASRAWGEEAAARFSDAASSWLSVEHPLRFGAFFGASFDRDGLADLRIYFERVPIPQTTPLAAPIAGTVPIFESLTLNRSGSITPRLYLCFSAGLRLQDLELLLNEVELGHRYQELYSAARELSGGLAIAPGQSIAGVRTLSNGSELKLDFIVMRPRAQEAERALRLHLSARPGSEAAYQRWREAVGAPTLSVLSIRVSTDSGVSLNAYAHPYAGLPSGATTPPAR